MGVRGCHDCKKVPRVHIPIRLNRNSPDSLKGDHDTGISACSLDSTIRRSLVSGIVSGKMRGFDRFRSVRVEINSQLASLKEIAVRTGSLRGYL